MSEINEDIGLVILMVLLTMSEEVSWIFTEQWRWLIL